MNMPQETRRTLARKYKETVRPAGVFAIRNTLSGRLYVAGSLDVGGAMSRAAGLEKILVLWREELQCHGDQGYDAP